MIIQTPERDLNHYYQITTKFSSENHIPKGEEDQSEIRITMLNNPTSRVEIKTSAI